MRTRLYFPKRYQPPGLRGDCGVCVVAGPDEYGQFELMEDPRCPEHGAVASGEAVSFGRRRGKNGGDRAAF